MSKEYDLPSDSDDDDEDYVPKGVDSEAGSEVESEGEMESSPEDENDENLKNSERGRGLGRKRGCKRTSKTNKRQKLETVRDEISREDSKEMEDKKHLTEEEEKKRADSLWADFMKDTSTVSSPKSTNSINSTHIVKKNSSPVTKPASTEKVKITKLFEFAGEEIRVEKEVPVDCAEARLNLPSTDSRSNATPSSKGGGNERGFRKGGLGGIASVLGQLGKKTKISTLEKSKLDWDSYKREENIGEEISTHNKGKDGYLEKQDFLQRADLRQFEIEKQLRSTRRSTR
ncbi:craniofacial development protein 1 [Athalia rosae]|uniref:craniofacial development protein 1 n=1 Tax=Athalia rosae TaxID=37344 RepID=UPI0020336B72|nr:craniofacial development protein 1 [Athalia rosae]